MTPLEIQSHRFARRMFGYDTAEVETFLRMITDDYEAAIKENDSQRERISHLQDKMEGLVQQEQLLKQTLINAQSISDRMRQSAERECNALLGEAETRAEKILDASHRRAARLASDIREMRGLRSRLAEALRGTIDTHLSLIGSLERDPEPDSLVDGMVEGKIAYLSASQPGRSEDDAEEVQVQAAPPRADTNGST